jgi:hypothetical protein
MPPDPLTTMWLLLHQRNEHAPMRGAQAPVQHLGQGRRLLRRRPLRRSLGNRSPPRRGRPMRSATIRPSPPPSPSIAASASFREAFHDGGDAVGAP